ncbi:MAG: undecaprenyldiphospho-muramoylpentapeptide beta-N-acetylglucosaminyltransferase [Clostridia bacterium]
MRYLISGGGTAGHINPAIAIASEIKRRDKNATIVFVGTKAGLETKLVINEGYELKLIDVKGLKRSLSLDNVKILFKAIRAMGDAKKIIKSFKPNIVIGTGGYVSGPVVKAAQQLKIPTVIHEQNAFWGVTTKMLAKHADKLLLSFPPSKEQNAEYKNTVVTGNPVRLEFGNFEKQSSRRTMFLSDNKPLVLIYGGSLGAKTINDSLVAMLPTIKKENKISIIAGVGKRDCDYIKKDVEKLGIKFNTDGDIQIKEYIYDMPRIMAACDLVVCRSGAITLAELALLEKPCILIPSPNVAENHQYYNAKVFSDIGAAEMILDKDVNGDTLLETINSIVFNKKKLESMSKASKKLAFKNASSQIGEIIMKTAKK